MAAAGARRAAGVSILDAAADPAAGQARTSFARRRGGLPCRHSTRDALGARVTLPCAGVGRGRDPATRRARRRVDCACAPFRDTRVRSARLAHGRRPGDHRRRTGGDLAAHRAARTRRMSAFAAILSADTSEFIDGHHAVAAALTAVTSRPVGYLQSGACRLLTSPLHDSDLADPIVDRGSGIVAVGEVCLEDCIRWARIAGGARGPQRPGRCGGVGRTGTAAVAWWRVRLCDLGFSGSNPFGRARSAWHPHIVRRRRRRNDCRQ